MSSSRKTRKAACVKLFGKIGCTLVTDLVYVIAHQLKSIYRTLITHYIVFILGRFDVFRKLLGNSEIL